MKDYLIKKEEKNEKGEFILNYKIEDDQVTIYYADGSNLIKKMNKETIESLNEKLKEQLIKQNELGKEKYIDSTLYDHKTRCYVELPIASSLAIMYGLTYDTSLLVFSTLFSAITIRELLVSDKLSKLLKDFKKNLLFTENEKFINEQLSNLNNDEVEINLSKNINELLINCDNSLDINKIDKTSLKEIKKLIKFLEKNKNVEEVKSKTLKK